jgi:hypothetical protein
MHFVDGSEFQVTRRHNVSDTETLSFFRWEEGDILLGSVTEVSSF